MHLFIIYLTRDRVYRAGKVIKDLSSLQRGAFSMTTLLDAGCSR